MSTKPTTSRRYAARLTAEERRPQLLDAALAVIVEHGYAGATLGAIAERAGVTKPVIYSVFANREAFFAALLDREEARALAAIGAAMPELADGATPRVVAAGVEGLLRAIQADPQPWRLIFTESGATPDAVRSRVARDRATIHTGLTALIAQGYGARLELDPALVAHALFAAVESFTRLAAAEGVDPAAAGAVVAALLPR